MRARWCSKRYGAAASGRPLRRPACSLLLWSFCAAGWLTGCLPALVSLSWLPMRGVLPVCCLQLESLPAMVQGVWSEDPQAQLEATTQFRKLLSIGGCWLDSQMDG